jgi:hypothetical protein
MSITRRQQTPATGTRLDHDLRPLTVVVVHELGAPDLAALGYARRIRAEEVAAVHFAREPFDSMELEATFTALGLHEDARLEVVRATRDERDALVSFVRSVPEGRQVDVIVPVRSGGRSDEMGRKERRALTELSMELLRLGRGRVTLLPGAHDRAQGAAEPAR